MRRATPQALAYGWQPPKDNMRKLWCESRSIVREAFPLIVEPCRPTRGSGLLSNAGPRVAHVLHETLKHAHHSTRVLQTTTKFVPGASPTVHRPRAVTAQPPHAFSPTRKPCVQCLISSSSFRNDPKASFVHGFLCSNLSDTSRSSASCYTSANCTFTQPALNELFLCVRVCVRVRVCVQWLRWWWSWRVHSRRFCSCWWWRKFLAATNHGSYMHHVYSTAPHTCALGLCW